MAELHYREFGDRSNPVALVFHGLLGSSRNWQSVGKELGQAFNTVCVDLRNHGSSPFIDPHTYDAMKEDVLALMASRGFKRCHMLGHSMGGKLAMKLGCESPGRVASLAIVDIAPKTYPKSHDSDYLAMRSVDTESIASRKEADAIMEPFVNDWAKRQFLLTNLKRNVSGSGFSWSINLDAIEANRREIESSPVGEGDRYAGPTLFILGGKSNYTNQGDHAQMKRMFPNCRIETIAESGHNPHIESKDRFLCLAQEFLIRSEAERP